VIVWTQFERCTTWEMLRLVKIDTASTSILAL
jgi:hypothetical protein